MRRRVMPFGALGAVAAVGAVLTTTMLVAPSAAAASVAGYEFAVQGSNGHVGVVGVDGVGVDLQVAMAAGVSPAIVGLGSAGGAEVVFQEATGRLARISPTIFQELDVPAAGTRPSVALSDKGFTEKVFQDPSGFVRRADGDLSSSSTGVQMSTPTSPAVAYNDGSVAHIVFTGTDGLLYDLTGQSKLTKVAGGISAKAGTTPAVAASGTKSVEIAFVGTDDVLYLFNEFTGVLTNTHQGVLPGTNPAIAADGVGGYVTAIVSSVHPILEVVNADGSLSFDGSLFVAAGTSPAIASDGRGGWRAAITDDTNHLATYDNFGLIVHTAALVAPRTSPAVAFVQPTPAPAPTNTNTSPPPPTTAETLTLSHVQDNSGFTVYAGSYPPFGSVQPGHVLSIGFPLDGFVDQELFFVKFGHSTSECGNSSAVVGLVEGQTTTSAQLSAIFGTSQPAFSTLQPFTALACLSTSSTLSPGFINLALTVQFN